MDVLTVNGGVLVAATVASFVVERNSSPRHSIKDRRRTGSDHRVGRRAGDS